MLLDRERRILEQPAVVAQRRALLDRTFGDVAEDLAPPRRAQARAWPVSAADGLVVLPSHYTNRRVSETSDCLVARKGGSRLPLRLAKRAVLEHSRV